MKKICTKCKVEKELDKFHKGDGKFGRNNWCKKCCKKYKQKYFQNNKEKIKEYKQKYFQNNKEKIKIRQQKYRQTEKGRLIRQKIEKKYFQTEQGKLVKHKAYSKRRSLLKKHLNTLTLQDWNQILESQNHKCAMCGKSFKKVKPTKDHIVPISKGGHTTKENIQALCQSCNSKKGAKILC